jgi:hypothetical protein
LIQRRCRGFEPMSLGNMRAQGIRSVEAQCPACWQEGIVNVDGWPDDYAIPNVGLRLVCSECGSTEVQTRPNWREHRAHGKGR